ncbi:U2 small nuclear ribonucleoprotein B [Striga asiatica]|uniref:U2 small nuclear ribonucleoprotein B n=1 Tax=Striga asiatica TaxID=4170 RepID=A0A5A7PYG5_STRAF|nr:U2 small nuclear ribonucleoprotein B [Striga asiatica]
MNKNLKPRHCYLTSPSSSSGPSTDPSSRSSSPPSSTEPSGCEVPPPNFIQNPRSETISKVSSPKFRWNFQERPIARNLLAAGKREVGMQGFVHDEASRKYGVFHDDDVGDDAASPAATVHDARLHLHRRSFSKVTLPF